MNGLYTLLRVTEFTIRSIKKETVKEVFSHNEKF